MWLKPTWLITVLCPQIPVQNPALDTFSSLILLMVLSPALKQTPYYLFLRARLCLFLFGVLWSTKPMIVWTQVSLMSRQPSLQNSLKSLEYLWYYKSKIF